MSKPRHHVEWFEILKPLNAQKAAATIIGAFLGYQSSGVNRQKDIDQLAAALGGWMMTGIKGLKVTRVTSTRSRQQRKDRTMALPRKKSVKDLTKDNGIRPGIQNLTKAAFAHPWAVVSKDRKTVVGCNSRTEARAKWLELQGKQPKPRATSAGVSNGEAPVTTPVAHAATA